MHEVETVSSDNEIQWGTPIKGIMGTSPHPTSILKVTNNMYVRTYVELVWRSSLRTRCLAVSKDLTWISPEVIEK